MRNRSSRSAATLLFAKAECASTSLEAADSTAGKKLRHRPRRPPEIIQCFPSCLILTCGIPFKLILPRNSIVVWLVHNRNVSNPNIHVTPSSWITILSELTIKCTHKNEQNRKQQKWRSAGPHTESWTIHTRLGELPGNTLTTDHFHLGNRLSQLITDHPALIIHYQTTLHYYTANKSICLLKFKEVNDVVAL